MNNNWLNSPAGLFALAVIACAALLLQLGAVPLFDEDEGAYAEVSREMLASGNWMVPTLEGKPFFHKPPMIYWTQALSISLLGQNEYALRLPSALASLAWVIIIFIFTHHHLGMRQAWLTVFFLVTALQTTILARAAIADALLNLFITAAMLSLYAHYHSGRRVWLLIAYGGMGMGFLTKGPIAVAIPVVVSLLFYLLQKNIRQWLKMAFTPLGWLIFILIALPWYIGLASTFGMDFVGEIFLVHNLGRFQKAMEGHSGPVFYYLPVIIAGLLPYTTVAVAAFAHLPRYFRSDSGRFLVLWFAVVFLLFSLAETKLPHYITYGYVPLLIFMTQALEHLKRPLLLMMPMVIFSLAIFFLPDIAARLAPFVPDDFTRLVIASALPEFGRGHYLIMSIITAASIAIMCIKPLSIQTRTVLTGLLFLGLINFYLLPKAGEIMQQPIKSAALLAREKGCEVVMWKMNYPSFNFYLGRPVLRRSPQPGDVVITKVDKLDRLDSHRILYQRHGFVLTEINKL